MAKRTVLFLGAGASVPFGYPTTDRLLELIWTQLQSNAWEGWSPLSNETKEKDAADCRELLGVILPGLTPAAPTASGVTITDIPSLLDQFLAEGRPPTRDWEEERLRRARRFLGKAINGVLQGAKDRGLRKQIAEWMIGQEELGNHITVVSTNYDTTIEQPLFSLIESQGRNVADCVDFGISWRDPGVEGEPHRRPRGSRLAILKLHGSLNWLRCQCCGYIYINVQGRIASLDTDVPTKYNTCTCEGRLRMITVTPSFVRDVRDANLLSIWNVVVEEMRNADEWMMVGYSLPAEDIAIRSILLRAFQTRTKPYLAVKVAQYENLETDPPGGRPERRRYELFFPATNLLEYRVDGAGKFFEDLVAKPLGQAPGSASP